MKLYQDTIGSELNDNYTVDVSFCVKFCRYLLNIVENEDSDITDREDFKEVFFSIYTTSVTLLSNVSPLLILCDVVHSPDKDAEEAEECVHEADVVGDAGDDCLLTVRTHGLHR